MTELRTAVRVDVPRIAELMRASVLEIFPAFYSAAQTLSASVHVARQDLDLIDDGTYFVHDARGEIVACGGWSRRHKLYAGAAADEGFTDLALMATLPGVPLYLACGFTQTESVAVILPDGGTLAGVVMRQSLSSRTSSWTTRRADGAAS